MSTVVVRKRFKQSYYLLESLIAAKGEIVKYEDLLLAMYPGESKWPRNATSVMQVSLCRIRKRLPLGSIYNYYGVGYVLDKAVAETLLATDGLIIQLDKSAQKAITP